MASSTRNQDWQSSKATIAERAKHMLIYGLYADCQFLVGPNGCEMVLPIFSLNDVRFIIHNHKTILLHNFLTAHQSPQKFSGYQ